MISSTRSIRLAALAAVLSLAFAACGGAASTAPSTAPSVAPSTEPSVAITPEPGTLPTPELSSIKVGVSVTEMSQYAAVLAQQLGLYQKYGLAADLPTVFEGDGKAVAALQAGQIDIGFTGTSSAISSQLTDAQYVVIGVNAVIVTDDLVCQAAIKTKEDVKGKTIAISTFGGTSNASALLALKSLGYGLNDAVITQVGGQSARIAALTGGSIDCAVVDSNLESDMVAQGFSILVQLKKAAIEYGRSGMGVMEDWLAKNPNTALCALAAVLEAQNVIFSTPDVAITAYASFRQIDAAAAKKQVDDFIAVGNRSLMWSDEAFNNARKVIAIVNPDIIDVPVTDAFDRSFIQKLVDIGFYEKIGSPVPAQ